MSKDELGNLDQGIREDCMKDYKLKEGDILHSLDSRYGYEVVTVAKEADWVMLRPHWQKKNSVAAISVESLAWCLVVERR